MTTKISLQQLIDLRACSNGISWYTNNVTADPHIEHPVAHVIDIFKPSFNDICWFASKTQPKEKLVRFAIDCAKLVSHLNTDPRVQKAIDTAEACLANPNSADAAYAAAAAADAAAYAADAAAYAAYAAYAAADAAAAAAAAYAAYAADAYADPTIKPELYKLAKEMFV